jgi:hypothetical protein
MSTGAARDEPPVAERFQLPAIIALAVVGGAVGFGVISIGGFGSEELTEKGQFHIWLFLICAQTALWTLGAAVFFDLLRTSPLVEVASEARPTARWATVAVAVPVLGLVLAVAVGATLDYPVPYRSEKVTSLSVAGVCVALVGVVALARVHVALRHRTPATKAGIDAYLELRAVLQRVLAVEGAIIGAAILASGALRNAAVAYHGGDNSAFPREDVLIYGAYFTLILAVIYAPVYQRLTATGKRLLDEACPAAEPSAPDWTASYDKRKKLEELLGLQLTTSGSFRAAVAITAPLSSSIVGLLLGAA